MRKVVPGSGCKGTGVTDCHGQCAHWLRNDRGFYMGCGTRPGGSSGRPTPTHRLPIDYRRGAASSTPRIRYKGCGGAGGQRRPPLRTGTRNAVRRGVCVEENTEKRKSKKPIAFAIGFLVGDGGFEPPKASPADLQSVPFGHSGNPPYYL